MVFLHGGGGYPDKLSLVQGVQVTGAAVAHSAAEAALQLEQDIGHWTLVRDACHHALRHQLFGAFLEITVCRTGLHGVA